MALGGFCKELLGAEAFKALTELYSQQAAADILNTKPHEVKSREDIYAAYCGFGDFLTLAKKFADGYDKITAEAQDAEEVVADDDSVHDIYRGDS